MGQLSVTVPHTLGRDAATKKLEELIPRLKREYSSQISDIWEQWDDDTAEFGLTTHGFDIAGQITIGERSVTITGNLPWLASMFSGTIEDAIRSEAAKLLA